MSVASTLASAAFKGVDLGDSSPTGGIPPGAASAVAGAAAAGAAAAAMNLPVSVPNISTPVAKEWVAKRKELIRPWGTFVRTANFNTPHSAGVWTTRVYKNVEHFQSNYVFVFVILFVYCLISSPVLLIAMGMSGGACWYAGFRDQCNRKLILGGKEVALAQQYMAIAVLSIPLFLFAGAGGAVFWVIGASIFLIGIHATFYNFDALEINDSVQLTGNIVEEV